MRRILTEDYSYSCKRVDKYIFREFAKGDEIKIDTFNLKVEYLGCSYNITHEQNIKLLKISVPLESIKPRQVFATLEETEPIENDTFETIRILINTVEQSDSLADQNIVLLAISRICAELRKENREYLDKVNAKQN